ncbi:hypothetical protein [Aeromonas media]|uniref:hypothetical protein n=1 Tax=Aeromonas media TaxID=651 RepID=UPI003D08A475
MKLTIAITPMLRVQLLHAQNIEIEVPDTAVPEGWQLVPMKPTRAMCEAFHNAHEEWENGDDWQRDSPDHQWKAMLAMAPKPEEDPE